MGNLPQWLPHLTPGRLAFFLYTSSSQSCLIFLPDELRCQSYRSIVNYNPRMETPFEGHLLPGLLGQAWFQMWLTVVSSSCQYFARDLFLFSLELLFFNFWQVLHRFLAWSSNSDGYWDFEVVMEPAKDWTDYSEETLLELYKYCHLGRKGSNFLEWSNWYFKVSTRDSDTNSWTPLPLWYIPASSAAPMSATSISGSTKLSAS